MKKTIYITGAAGFIGKNAAKYFAANNWKVIGFGLGEWTDENFQDWGIEEWHYGEITTELFLSANKKPDAILHCAGGSSVGFSVENPEKDFEMTVGSTKQVLEYIRLNCPNARLLYPSSAAVYGQKKDAPIKEADELEPTSPYGFHKKIAEELCEQYSNKYNINVSIIRLFSVYGPGLQKQLLWDACVKISKAEKEAIFFGTGNETRDWIHIKDVAELFFLAVGSRENFEIINGGTGRRVQIREVLQLLVESYGKSIEAVFNGVNKVGDPIFYLADINKALSLGWKSNISLEDGIREYVNYFKKKND